MNYPEQLLAVLAAGDHLSKAAALECCEPPADGAMWTILAAPDRPGRSSSISEGQPARRRKGIEDPHGRLRFLHAIWHIELTAVDLCCLLCLRAPGMPQEFHRDHLGIARDEAIHAGLVADYLADRGYPPGSEPVHHRLWVTALAAEDVGEQLVVVPRFLEARGLDVSAELLPRMAAVDEAAHAVVERIYHDEIRHVSLGTEWHRRWCEDRDLDPVEHFKSICDKYFGDQIPSAFELDRDGRTAAGFWPEEIEFLAGE